MKFAIETPTILLCIVVSENSNFRVDCYVNVEDAANLYLLPSVNRSPNWIILFLE